MASVAPRVVFLNRCYWPDTEATGQLLADLCQHLSLAFDVHVVCGQPNSPLPGATYVASGCEFRDGVTIHRLRHTQFGKRVRAGRLVNLISFSHAVRKYLRQTQLAADVIVSETDPFLLPIAGASHASRVGARFVCHLQDIYPDVAEAIGTIKPGMLTAHVRHRLRTAYCSADRIVVLGNCMRERLETETWSIDSEKIRVIPNWADCRAIVSTEAARNAFRTAHGLQDRFVVMHSGNMGLTQRLDVLVSATTDPHWPDQALLLLVGDGASQPDLQRQAKSISGDRVRFLPYQPRAKLGECLSAADLHVVSMHENICGCLCPSKLYGILAAARPVLAIAGEQTDLYRTVQQHDLGWCCQPGDAAAIARIVEQSAAIPEKRLEISRRARLIAKTQFDREVVIEQYANMLCDLLVDPPVACYEKAIV